MKRDTIAWKTLSVSRVLFLTLLSAVPASWADGKAGPDGKTLFDKKCSACHGLSLTTSRREWKPEWKGIVDRMVRKRDGWISAEEAVAIVDYLSAAYSRD